MVLRFFMDIYYTCYAYWLHICTLYQLFSMIAIISRHIFLLAVALICYAISSLILIIILVAIYRNDTGHTVLTNITSTTSCTSECKFTTLPLCLSLSYSGFDIKHHLINLINYKYSSLSLPSSDYPYQYQVMF